MKNGYLYSLNIYIQNHPLRFLFAWFLLITILKSALSFQFQAPQALGDEMLYDLKARMFLLGDLFYGTGQYPPGYPAVLSFSHLAFSEQNAAYHGELIINAVLSSLTIYPSFFILRRFSSVLTAVMGSLTVSVAPVILSSSFLIMSENLFILLILVVSSGFVHFLSESQPSYRDIITGILMVSLIAVRHTGIAIICGFLVALIYYAALNRRDLTLALKKILYMISPLIVIGMVLAIYPLLSDKIVRILQIFLVQTPGQLPEIFGSFPTFLQTTTLNVLYLVYSPYPFLFAAALWYVWMVFRGAAHEDISSVQDYSENCIKEKVFLVFILASSVFLLVITIIFLFCFVDNLIPQVYGRYIDPIVPLIIIFGFAGTELLTRKVRGSHKNTWKVFIPFFILISLVALVSFLPHLVGQNNNAGLFYLYFFSSTFTGLVLLLPLFLSICYCALITSNISLEKILALIFLTCLLTSIPIINWQIHQSQNYGEIHRAFDTIQVSLGDDAVYVWDVTGNTGRFDPVYRDSIKFWIGDRLVEQRASVVTTGSGEKAVVIENLTKGDYLISRADYPLKKGTRMDEFWFYPILLTIQNGN